MQNVRQQYRSIDTLQRSSCNTKRWSRNPTLPKMHVHRHFKTTVVLEHHWCIFVPLPWVRVVRATQVKHLDRRVHRCTGTMKSKRALTGKRLCAAVHLVPQLAATRTALSPMPAIGCQ
jgi:hypothetical protein